jgi:hypothetical protein
MFPTRLRNAEQQQGQPRNSEPAGKERGPSPSRSSPISPVQYGTRNANKQEPVPSHPLHRLARINTPAGLTREAGSERKEEKAGEDALE